MSERIARVVSAVSPSLGYEKAERRGLALQKEEAVPPPLPSTPAEFIPIEDLGQ